MLVALQAPGATYVAGFRAWLGLGYCVRKGERALRILAPVPLESTPPRTPARRRRRRRGEQ